MSEELTITPGPIRCWECHGTSFLPVFSLHYDENLRLVEVPRGHACHGCKVSYKNDLLRAATAWQQCEARLAALAPDPPAPAPAPRPPGETRPLSPGAVSCWICDGTEFTSVVGLKYDERHRLQESHIGHVCHNCNATFDRDLLRSMTRWQQESQALGHFAEQAAVLARRQGAATQAPAPGQEDATSPQ